MFAYTQIGSAALVSLDAAHIAPPTEAHISETRTEGGADVHWGSCLHPHHFNFDEGTSVKARTPSGREITCRAVSVVGKGEFQESPKTSVEFENGGIIVQGSDGQGGTWYKLFDFEEFKNRFLLENGSKIELLLHVGFQTPRK